VVETRRILVVCSGNICRSPMAAAILRRDLEKAGIPALVLSAGTLGIHGTQAAPAALEAMKAIGLELGDHRSQGLSTQLARVADDILVMAPEHVDEVLEREATLEPKLVRLWEYTDPPGALEEIADPIGQNREAFVRCRELIEGCVARWVDRLKRLHY
jgi:protein-tyrosine phosphatase